MLKLEGFGPADVWVTRNDTFDTPADYYTANTQRIFIDAFLISTPSEDWWDEWGPDFGFALLDAKPEGVEAWVVLHYHHADPYGAMLRRTRELLEGSPDIAGVYLIDDGMRGYCPAKLALQSLCDELRTPLVYDSDAEW